MPRATLDVRLMMTFGALMRFMQKASAQGGQGAALAHQPPCRRDQAAGRHGLRTSVFIGTYARVISLDGG